MCVCVCVPNSPSLNTVCSLLFIPEKGTGTHTSRRRRRRWHTFCAPAGMGPAVGKRGHSGRRKDSQPMWNKHTARWHVACQKFVCISRVCVQEQELNITVGVCVWEAGKQQRSTWNLVRSLGFPPQATGLQPIRHTWAYLHQLSSMLVVTTLGSLTVQPSQSQNIRLCRQ